MVDIMNRRLASHFTEAEVLKVRREAVGEQKARFSPISPNHPTPTTNFFLDFFGRVPGRCSVTPTTAPHYPPRH